MPLSDPPIRTAERAAFDAAPTALLPTLYRTALHVTRNVDAASDLVQDAALRAYRAFAQFRPGTNFRA